MATNRIEAAKQLNAIGKMADTSLMANVIDKDDHKKIKSKVRELELDNLFKAMADYCSQ